MAADTAPPVERRAVAAIATPPVRMTAQDLAAAPIRSFERDTIFRRALAGADAVAVSLALLVAPGPAQIGLAALLVPLLAVLAAKTMGLYDRDQQVLRKRTIDEVPALFQLATLLTLVTWIGHGALLQGTLTSRTGAILWALLFANLILARVAGRRVAQGIAPVERCMVVGEPEVHERLREKLDRDPHVKGRVVAYLPLLERRLSHGGPVPHEALEALVAEQHVHRVIVAPEGADHRTTLEVVSRAKALGVNVSVLPRICEVVGSSVEFDELGGMTLLGVRPFGLQRSSRWLKRAMDVAGALAGLLVAGPALAAIAVAVRLTSRGPVLFRQTRVGRDGTHFRILKFRTMVLGADDARAALAVHSTGNGLFKVRDDPRVTRVGRFLRRTSLDELPQLWNVLRGDMSLVGPRPLILEEDRLVAGWHRRRLHLKPGLTGPWQVLGSPDTRVGLSEMVTIDYLYAANWSLWADVQVILRTIAYVLGGRGV